MREPRAGSSPHTIERIRVHLGDAVVELVFRIQFTVNEHSCSCSLETEDAPCKHILAAMTVLGVKGAQ